MKLFFYLKVFLIVSVMLCINACRCSCTCDQAAGCRTLVARDIHSGDTLAIRKYCSVVNIDTDRSVADSVRVFQATYSTSTSFVEFSDSIYRRYRVANLKCDETDFYTDQDYTCECAK